LKVTGYESGSDICCNAAGCSSSARTSKATEVSRTSVTSKPPALVGDIRQFSAAIPHQLVRFNLIFACQVRPLGNEVMVVCALLKVVAERLGTVNATQLQTGQRLVLLRVQPIRSFAEGGIASYRGGRSGEDVLCHEQSEPVPHPVLM
jgi:hypothetical protein